MKNRLSYYLPFIPEAKINYIFLLDLMDLAAYDKETRLFDTVYYDSLRQLAEQLNSGKEDTDKYRLSPTTLSRYLFSAERAYKDYRLFLTADKALKQIHITANFAGTGKQPFVILSQKEAYILRHTDTKIDGIEIDRNLLIKYYVYLKYYCGYNQKAKRKTDTTAL